MGNVCAYQVSIEKIEKKNFLRLPYEEIFARREEAFSLREATIETIQKSLENEGETLSYIQVKRIFGSFGLKKQNIENPDHPHAQFIFSFEKQEKFKKIEVLAACVMLTNEKPSKKLEFFFSIFDQEKTQIFNKNMIEQMLAVMFEASCYHCLFLAYGLDTNSISFNNIQKYSKILSVAKEMFINEICLMVLLDQPEIGKERFISSMLTPNNSQILTPRGLRKYIHMINPIQEVYDEKHQEN